MTPTAPARPAIASADSTELSPERRAFLRARLTLFAGAMFVTNLGILAWQGIAYWLYPSILPNRAREISIASAATCAVLFAVWLALRRGRALTSEQLRRVDAITALALGGAFGFAMYAAMDQYAVLSGTFMLLMCAVFGRVLIVPSSGRRTALLSTGSILPAATGFFAIAVLRPHLIPGPPVAVLIGSLLICGVVVALATIGSSVIYGLRKQVREARQLGQYTLLEEIGGGAMGTVYRARHAMLRRPTAVKLLNHRGSGEAAVARFEREVQLTSELTHPNTVAIFDYGRTPAGQFYYAMEFLDGIDLERLVRLDGPLSAGRVIHIVRQVCGALAEAHDKGLIHRDIKPANILLCERGAVADVAKIVDFGLVKDLDTDASLTSDDVLAGTPAYISPEAITAPQLVGRASDIYALGAVMYTLLTGEIVFTGSTIAEVCGHHAFTAPVPPSKRGPGCVPPDLEAVIMKCLAKRPADRYPSASALGDALAQLADAEAWSQAEARAWWRAFGQRRGRSNTLAPDPLGPTLAVDMRERPAG